MMAHSKNPCEPDHPLDPTSRGMFWSCLIWTVVHMGLFWHEFLKGHSEVPGYLTEGYASLLLLYFGMKVRERWTNGRRESRRLGPFFVFMWLGSLLLMGIVDYASAREYHLPHAMPGVIMMVSSVYGLTIAEKTLHDIIYGRKNGDGSKESKPPE
jgi:hypothetical protein